MYQLAALPFLALFALALPALAAEPDYRTIRMEIDVAKPAAQVWKKIGGYCDISNWLDADCKITAGDGDIGTVRSLSGGAVLEIMVAATPLSYGYTQPAVEGKFHNLYHGFLEARPISTTTSKLLYTLYLDVSDKPDAASKEADISSRRARFEGALKTMKKISETQ